MSFYLQLFYSIIQLFLNMFRTLNNKVIIIIFFFLNIEFPIFIFSCLNKRN